jgi:hypothetical protein
VTAREPPGAILAGLALWTVGVVGGMGGPGLLSPLAFGVVLPLVG